jgi:hypothetical protein
MTNMRYVVAVAAFLLLDGASVAMAAPGDTMSVGPDTTIATPPMPNAPRPIDKPSPRTAATPILAADSAATVTADQPPGAGSAASGPKNAAGGGE